MKKVLIVIPTLGTGGGEKLVLDLACGLSKKEYQVKLLVLYPKTNSIFDDLAEEQKLDVVYLNKRVGIDWKLFSQVRSVVKAYAPDVIHTHLDTMLYLLPQYRRKQRKFHTVHSLAEKEASGMQRAVRFAAFKLLGVKPVAVSRAVQESIAQVYGISKNKIPSVPNGIVCSRYDLPKVPGSCVRLITVASMHGVKNHKFLIDCFAEVLRKTERVHLTLVGDGVLRPDIEKQIRQLRLDNRVTLVGIVADVENYLAKSDIYVAASLYEGLPLSMLEAMASGLPIVSTAVGGVREIVRDGVNGRMTAPGDRDAYIGALTALVRDPELRKQLGAASKCIAKEYDISQTVAGYEALYGK